MKVWGTLDAVFSEKEKALELAKRYERKYGFKTKIEQDGEDWLVYILLPLGEEVQA